MPPLLLLQSLLLSAGHHHYSSGLRRLLCHSNLHPPLLLAAVPAHARRKRTAAATGREATGHGIGKALPSYRSVLAGSHASILPRLLLLRPLASPYSAYRYGRLFLWFLSSAAHRSTPAPPGRLGGGNLEETKPNSKPRTISVPMWMLERYRARTRPLHSLAGSTGPSRSIKTTSTRAKGTSNNGLVATVRFPGSFSPTPLSSLLSYRLSRLQ